MQWSALDTLPESKDINIGKSCPDDVKQDLKQMIDRAIDKGLPEEYVPKFQNLVFEFKDIFRNKIGTDPPSSTPPMIINLNLMQNRFVQKFVDTHLHN